MKTWLLVAAERREFSGLLKRMAAQGAKAVPLDWPAAKFAREVQWQGYRWWMIANGPGPGLVKRVLSPGAGVMAGGKTVDAVISTGFCGALDPALRVGDIVVGRESNVVAELPFVRGEICCCERVVVTAEQKRQLREKSGAIAIEMEAAAVKQAAQAWGAPFAHIRVVSDTANETLPLDFNLYRSSSGEFSRTRIALAAIARPFSVMPRLLAFDRNCSRASEALGDFLANCRF